MTPDTKLLAGLSFKIINHDLTLGTYKKALKTEEKLTEIFAALNLTFPKDLFDVLTSGEAPSTAWLISNASDDQPKLWGIYCLLFTNDDGDILIYIGSATSVTGRLRCRVASHRNASSTSSSNNRAALANGFRIAHVVHLAKCPIPPPGKVPLFRVAMVTLEAAFHCLFWSMHNPNSSYGFARHRPWPADAYEWAGLNSHNPVMVAPNSQQSDLFDEEELARLASEAAERARMKRLAAKKRQYQTLKARYLLEPAAKEALRLRKEQARKEALSLLDPAAKEAKRLKKNQAQREARKKARSLLDPATKEAQRLKRNQLGKDKLARLKAGNSQESQAQLEKRRESDRERSRRYNAKKKSIYAAEQDVKET